MSDYNFEFMGKYSLNGSNIFNMSMLNVEFLKQIVVLVYFNLRCQTRKNLMILSNFTRQNKQRVRPRSKQCISIFSRTPALIQISEF